MWPKISIKLINSFSLDKINFFPKSVNYLGINIISISAGERVVCDPIGVHSQVI